MYIYIYRTLFQKSPSKLFFSFLFEMYPNKMTRILRNARYIRNAIQSKLFLNEIPKIYRLIYHFSVTNQIEGILERVSQ